MHTLARLSSKLAKYDDWKQLRSATKALSNFAVI